MAANKIQVPDYVIIREIHREQDRIFVAAAHEKTHKPVILMLVSSASMAGTSAMLIERDWTKAFNFNLILNRRGFFRTESYQGIELDYFNGINLEIYLANTQLLVQFSIEIAENITSIVEELQYYEITHRDIRPVHFLINPDTREIRLVDLSNAIPDNKGQSSPSFGGGEIGLQYISPEQSGLSNLSTDYRSEYYHLGVIFYRLFTGRLPFENTDPNEIVHAHLARTAVPPSELADTLVPASQIIMKLLSKKPDERYQTTRGIVQDFATFKNILAENANLSSFQIGVHDSPNEFIIPDRLYGRENDLELVINSFNRIKTGNELVLILGNSGIGKSSLVREVQNRLERMGALFLTGKFDQYVQNIPFEGIVKCLRDLVNRISMENSEYWRYSILDALGSSAGIIIDVIPELEKVVGHQNPVDELPPVEAQNRFINVFVKFINLFTKSEKPLILFLDDLQWADTSSLNFLIRVTSSLQGGNLLIIGAYRDNEVSTEHPLRSAIKDWQRENANLLEIRLFPLEIQDVISIMADTFSCPKDKVAPLADAIMSATFGNPYFISEMLKALFKKGLFKYEEKMRKWKWDLRKITTQTKSLSSEQLLVSKINKLPQPARTALITASCVGSNFDSTVLAALHDKTPHEAEEDLYPALVEDLLAKSSNRYLVKNNYRFVHDQVQQAAYNCLSDQERAEIHIAVGYFLLDKLSFEEKNQQLFEIVNHLNHHPETFPSDYERRRVAELNLQAGKKAKASSAYSVAFFYFLKGKERLVSADWEESYKLAFELHLNFAESSYMSDRFTTCVETIIETIPHARDVNDKVLLNQIQIQCLILNDKFEKAIELALSVLGELGVNLPDNPGNLKMTAAYLKSKWLLRGKEIEDLASLPKMNNVLAEASMVILQNVAAVAFQKKPILYTIIVLKMLELSLKYGITAESAVTFATYGAIINAIESNHDASYRYGLVGLKMVGRAMGRTIQDRTLLVFNIVNRVSGEHINNSLEPLRTSYQKGVEIGDLEYCTYASTSYCFHLLISGKNLRWVKEEMLRFNEPPKAFSKGAITHGSEQLIQIASNLLGENSDPTKLSGTYFDEKADQSAIFEQVDPSRIFASFVSKAFLSYLSEQYEIGLGFSENAAKNNIYIKGSLFEPLFSFYHGLLCVSMFRDGGGRGSYLKTAKLERDRMRKWANQVPINFAHRYHLMEAEIFAIQGKIERALEHYDLSIKTALTNEHPHEAAIANELCGRYWLDRGQLKTGMIYIKASYAGYQEWGCVIKERQLLKAFPELGHLDAQPGIYHFLTGGDSIASTLDLSTLMKASTAISGEVVFDRLMKKLMQFAIENAGAQSGYFILDWDGALFIEAQHSVIGELGDIRRIPLTESDQVPTSIIAHVFGTKMDVVLHDAQTSELFKSDPVVITKGIRSALCIPALNQGKILGVLYLENNLSTSVFTNERTQLLKLLSGQIAVSIENAILYEKLEQKVAVRTAEIETQKEEIERQRQLVEEKSRFKEQFFANMSHEIRTPMTAILGMSDLIFDTPLNTKQLEYAKGIRYSSENLLAIINDILDYSKIEAGKFSFVNKPFQIRDRMERLGYVLRLIAKEKGLELDIDVENDVSPQLIGDPIRLHQVLLNLASNALKFTDTGSVSLNISVSTRKGTHEELLFRVTDTGIGIAEEKLDYIFETFTRIDEELNNSQSGTGLGLFIAKKLVEEQGGEMKVSSQLGQGTEFSFKLEFEICHVDGVQAETDEGPLSSGLKVLLVEDNLFNQVVAEETLKKLIRDVQVTVADNGQIALQKLVEGEFDIVLMDVKMPVMDGYKATRAIRAKETTTRVPILAFTSNANPKEFQKCLDAGMDDYITKPIEAQKLKNKIRKLTDNTKRSNSTS